MMTKDIVLDFERHIVELENKVNELRKFSAEGKFQINSELKKLEEKLEILKKETYNNLTPWQRVQLARHPQRPYTTDYIGMIVKDFTELHGDRSYADDKAIITGFGCIDKHKVVIIGHQKGRDTKENLFRNFGCAHPEGYRKALRAMRLAEKFNKPIVIFVDTPGAYPGIGAEERGQAQAIAENICEMFKIAVPIVVIVIGEGGSGGALGIGVGDVVCVLENAYYSVISPEGCAAILWKDGSKTSDSAAALKLTAKDLSDLGVIDKIIPEPLGGAHRDIEKMSKTLEKEIVKYVQELAKLPKVSLLKNRFEKFRRMGIFEDVSEK